jgi:hypothetical protein
MAGLRHSARQNPVPDHRLRARRRGSRGARGFWDGRNEWLRGVNDPHVRTIESLQPYRGVAWTATLRDLSNPDKHREPLQLGVQREGGEVNIMNIFAPEDVNRPGAVPLET